MAYLLCLGLACVSAISELPPHATDLRAHKTRDFTALPQCNMSAGGQPSFKGAKWELLATSQPHSFLCLLNASCVDPHASEAALMASSIFPRAEATAIYFYLQFKFPLEVQASLWRLGCRATHKHSERVSTPATGTTGPFGLICHSSCSPEGPALLEGLVQGLKEARRPTGTHWGEIRKESQRSL